MPSLLKFGVGQEKLDDLARRMEDLGILEEDLTEKFVRSSGPGGQKVNKTSTAVYLRHEPSGIEVKAQLGRSQAMNRFHARRLLVEKLETIRDGKKAAAKARAEKIRRQKRKRSKRAKEKVLQAKHQQSNKKQQRQKPKVDD